jgi:acyl-CoA synthetase (AMP-forming)/AMP-acid ligase II
MPADRVNVADRLSAAAASASPRQQAVIARGKRTEHTLTFAQLEADATALARGFIDLGVRPGTRLALLVPPSPEFVALVFALLRSGATTILIDPGMGKKHLVNCLAAAEPEGFIAISKAQAVRTLMKRRFPHAKLNVTIGRRWFWGGVTYEQLLGQGRASAAELPTTYADDPAAIIFTSGSTGPPKGVLYTHRMFDAQASEIQRAYDIKPGGVDLACFALFGLFNAAWGVTTVFPHMDFSRPASADPLELLAAANLHRVTQAFASPAIWDKLSSHCKTSGMRIPSLREIFSCGAPVRSRVAIDTIRCVTVGNSQDVRGLIARMHTPYGATEALPIATIEAQEIFKTALKTHEGAGVCVGRKFDSIEWRVIRIREEPIADIREAEVLPDGQIGELIVRGPQVSPSYSILPAPSPLRGGPGRGAAAGTSFPPPSLTLPAEGRGPDSFERANAFARIADGADTWHRMGDVGYIDAWGRFWYCGRKSHRVETSQGPLYSECVEAIFNRHGYIRRCALVGIGARPNQTPVIVYETALPRTIYPDPSVPDAPRMPSQLAKRIPSELAVLAASNPATTQITHFLRHPRLPVDVRHNAKINREALAAWAAKKLCNHSTDALAEPPASRLPPPA